MLTDNETLQWLDKWADKEISLEALEAALQYPQAATLEAMTKEHLQARQAIESFAIAREVRSVHTAFVQQYRHQRQAKTFRIKTLSTTIMRVAATIVVLLGVFTLGNIWLTDTNALYRQLDEPYYIANERSSSRPAEADSIIIAFQAKDYAQVAQLFDQLEQPGSRELFFAGYAALQLNNTDTAIALLEQLRAYNQLTNTYFYQDDAEYYLALSYLKAGNLDEAYHLLTAIQHNPEHTYQSSIGKKELLILRCKRWL